MILFQFQTGEYFVLALIMFGASLIFVFLSIFYYDYVPEDAFANIEAEEVELEEEKLDEKAAEAGVVNETMDTEEALEDKKADEDKGNQTADL